MSHSTRKLMKNPESSIFLVIALGLLAIGLLIIGDSTWKKQIQRNVPIYDNLMQARIYLTKGQMLLERRLSENDSIRAEDIWPYYERVELALGDCVNGRSTIIQLAGLPTEDHEMLSQIRRLRKEMKTYLEVSRMGRETPETMEAVSIPHGRASFYRMEHAIDAIYYRVLRNIGKMMDDRKKTHSIVLSSWILILSLVCGLVFFSDKKRRRAENAMRNAFDELETRVRDRTRQLEDANKQLRLEIDERKQAEHALKESESFIKTVMDNLPVGVAVNTVESTVDFAYMNDNFPRFYRTTRAALSDPDSFWSAVYEDPVYREIIRKKVLADIADGDPGGMHWEDVPITRKDEETTFVNARNIPVPDKKLMISTVLDVTDRKRAEDRLKEYSERLEEMVEKRTRELRNAQDELILKERLAVIGHFSGNISHEIRNPLAVIDSSAFYLKMKLRSPDEKIGRHLESIAANVKQATAIIESLLNLSRMEKPKTEINELADLVHETIRSSKIPRTVEVVADLPKDRFFVDAEREQLRMALKNVMRNAVQAMNGKGRLTVAIRKAETGTVDISVADTGPGILPEMIGKVFEPLFSTKTHGIGFGLSIAKMIVENHGGTIWAESGGAGVVFVLRLPAP